MQSNRLLLGLRQGLGTTIIGPAQSLCDAVSTIITITYQRKKEVWRRCLARALVQIPTATSARAENDREQERWGLVATWRAQELFKAPVGALASCQVLQFH